MLEDGCWEFHVDSFFRERQNALWAGEFVQKLKARRAEWGDSIHDREL
jgi:nucleotide exchange factor SIL1